MKTEHDSFTFNLWNKLFLQLTEKLIIITIIIIIITTAKDLGLSNFSPSRSIFGYSHPAPASRPAQIVPAPGLRGSYTTFTVTRYPL
jgi:hypothetical protein